MLGLYLFIIAAIFFAALVWFEERAPRVIWSLMFAPFLIILSLFAGLLGSALATIMFLKVTKLRLDKF
jgi:hypothetical protein